MKRRTEIATTIIAVGLGVLATTGLVFAATSGPSSPPTQPPPPNPVSYVDATAALRPGAPRRIMVSVDYSIDKRGYAYANTEDFVLRWGRRPPWVKEAPTLSYMYAEETGDKIVAWHYTGLIATKVGASLAEAQQAQARWSARTIVPDADNPLKQSSPSTIPQIPATAVLSPN